MSLPVVDLFAGAGGLSLGLKAAGCDVIAAVECDTDAGHSYACNHPSARVYSARVKDVVQGKAAREWRRDGVVVVGGPPCQPWSPGGHRRGQYDPRDGLPEFVAAVRKVDPAAFLLENSFGLGRGASRAHLAALVKEFEGDGYAVSSAVLNAADYGVPQRRRRLFLVGVRRVLFRWPRRTHGPGRAKPWAPARDFLRLAPVGVPNESPVTYARNPHIRPGPYDGLLWNGGGRPIDLGGPSPTILASAGNKVPWIDTCGIVPEYHAHLRAGGKPRTGVVPGARRITISEAASLQTFPAECRFEGALSSQFRQVGNAVPPRLAAMLGRALVRAVAEGTGS